MTFITASNELYSGKMKPNLSHVSDEESAAMQSMAGSSSPPDSVGS